MQALGLMNRLKGLAGGLYLRNPGTTWDVESWVGEGGSGVNVTEVIVEAGRIQDYPAPRAAAVGSEVVALASIVGTFRRYYAVIPEGGIAGTDGFTVMPDGRFLMQTAWGRAWLETIRPISGGRGRGRCCMRVIGSTRCCAGIPGITIGFARYCRGSTG